MRILTVLLVVSFLFTGCFEEKAGIPMEALHGEWTGASWLVKGEDVGRDASAVTFEFNADSTYSAGMGGSGETGVYRMDGNKLYTTAKGDAEKNVELEKVTTDSIFMNMNRQGTLETLILVRK